MFSHHSHWLNEDSGVTLFTRHYSLFSLPKILQTSVISVQASVISHPIPMWQVEEKIEARREEALLLVPRICPAQKHCWPDV